MKHVLNTLAIVCLAISDGASGSTAAMASDQSLSAETYRLRNSKDFDETALRYLKNENTKIVPGKRAPEGKYPWQVSLVISWIPDPSAGHFCGGSIVNERWILSASHCLHNVPPDDVNIVVGTNHLVSSAKRLSVKRVITHRQFDSDTVDFDVALIELRDPIRLSKRIKPIALLDGDDEQSQLVDGRPMWVTGWGATREGGETVKDLREVSVPLVGRGRCSDPLSYGNRISENMICAGETQGGSDSCQGDSGGPLVLMDLKPPRLAGIVSWGDGCARPDKYGVYTRVPVFMGWISACTANPDTCQQ